LPQETTTLSFIASNYAPLASLSAEGAKDALLEEIVEYLPIAPPDVESWEIRPNTQVPHPEGTLASPSLHAPFAQ
jgi:hypothetical protein